MKQRKLNQKNYGKNTNQAFQGSVYSAFTTHVVDGIRAQYGTNNKYNTYQKIEKTLMNMSEVIDNKGKGLNIHIQLRPLISEITRNFDQNTYQYLCCNFHILSGLSNQQLF